MSDLDTAILDFERRYPVWRYAGMKEAEVRARFGLSMTAYLQRLNRLLSDPEALAHDAQTIRRLTRVRDGRVGKARTVARVAL